MAHARHFPRVWADIEIAAEVAALRRARIALIIRTAPATRTLDAGGVLALSEGGLTAVMSSDTAVATLRNAI